MDYITTVRLNEEQEQALTQAEGDYDLSRSYLIRKAIELVYVLKLVSITDAYKVQQEKVEA